MTREAMLGGVRKAYASKGDDTTLTRWIKLPGRHSGHVTKPMPADATGTRFPRRVLAPDANILVSGHSNVKLGRDVRKGHLRGYWIYSLSLTERVTCPPSCHHWTTCYGNAMPFGKRVDHTHPDFLPLLEANIARLLAVRGRKGILIRLHELGDFYSVEYVQFWRRMVRDHPRLALFGYTAHAPHTPIGAEIAVLLPMIRFSNGGLAENCTVPRPLGSAVPAGAFQCPEQTGATIACATCAACWSTRKNVAFLEH